MDKKRQKPAKPAKDQDLKPQIAQLTEDLKRAHADFINYRRRNEEEKLEIMTIAKKEVISQFLPILDGIERAQEHIKSQDPVAKGYQMLANQLRSTFQQLGVEEIKAAGEQFDPHLHEAIEFKDGEGDQEVVSEVLKKGYKINDLVLRPAVVKVGKGELR